MAFENVCKILAVFVSYLMCEHKYEDDNGGQKSDGQFLSFGLLSLW